MPSRISVEKIDTTNGTVLLELVGPSRPPEPRLFVLTDDRGRRFVPALANCNPASGKSDSDDAAPVKSTASDGSEAPPPHWKCRLTIAPGYRRAVLTGVSMEWGDRVVSALPGQVKARWAAARVSPPAEPAGESGDDGPPSSPGDAATSPGGPGPPPVDQPPPAAPRRDDEPDDDEPEPSGPE
jgi:hypothetical protein